MAKDLQAYREDRPSFGTVPPRGLPRADSRPDLTEALAVIRLRKWSIALITVVMTFIALFLAYRQIPIYTASAKVLVTAVGVDPSTNQLEDPNLATEAEVVDSGAVADLVAANLAKDHSYSGDPVDLLHGLGVGFTADTNILEVSYSNPNPAVAKQRAEAFAEGYLQFRDDFVKDTIQETANALTKDVNSLQAKLNTALNELDKLGSLPRDDPRVVELGSRISALQLLIQQKQAALYNLPVTFSAGRVIQPAEQPSAPSSPNIKLDAMFGLVAGLAVGIGAAFLRDRLSGRLRSAADVEDQAGASVVGAIPRIPGGRQRRHEIVLTKNSRSAAAEAYGFLRTAVLSHAATFDAKSILVTSPHIGDGKSATVANLGFVLARAGKRVTLMSADLRRPSLGEYFRLFDTVGVVDVLQGNAKLEDALIEVPVERPRAVAAPSGPTALRILTSGRLVEDPSDLLGSPRMTAMIHQLEEESDVVLIDSPPILPVTDALVLASIVDSVLLVLGPTSMTRSVVASARQALDRVDGRLLGVVLSRAEIQQIDHGY